MTERVHWRDVAPVTVTVFRNVEAPLTPSVLLRAVAHVTPSVHWIVAFPVLRKEPERSKLYPGEVVQIPMNEPDSNRRALVIPLHAAMNLVR